jgi:flavin reductase (DIM6/NTAB) family NADH-FMN oxidoreductase RutF
VSNVVAIKRKLFAPKKLYMIRKKPWNRINAPVYSVSTAHGAAYNMNICTYTTAVSMQPKQFIVAIYEDTKTLELVKQSNRLVLQLLAEPQYRLIPLLGQKSGKKIDKIARLEKRSLISEWQGFKILKEALAVMELKIINSFAGGDHQLFLCELVAYKNLNEGEALSLDTLRAHQLIRI